MQYRNLGRSGAIVSELALGTMTFGRETDEDGSFAQLDAFAAAGGTLLDTADVYSGGVSETIVGKWFASRPDKVTDRMVIATKGRFPTDPADPNAVGLSRRHLDQALTASLRRLGVDTIDLYQVHWPNPFVPDSTIMAGMRKLQDEGVVRNAGVPGCAVFSASDAAPVHLKVVEASSCAVSQRTPCPA